MAFNNDQKKQREEDLAKILSSEHPRRVVVAGPGTGKSYLFQRAIAEERKKGNSRFLALTFIGKLGDALADDLAGLAETTTLHAFARRLVLEACPKGWEYYPQIAALIAEDLGVKEIKYEIGDEKYEERTKHYRTVGNEDVVHYALKICQKDAKYFPIYDLILVDEFQDFNAIEATFIDLLATKNKVLVVGDDDQALYEFKGSSPKYIRAKFVSAEDYEKHTLRFCSRCPEVVIKGFHGIVDHFKLNKEGSERIKKDYVCYLPDKQQDSDQNPKLYIFENAPPGKIPFLIKEELARILKTQKIKSALVIGESKTCKAILGNIARKLRDYGFEYVDHRDSEIDAFVFRKDVVNAYKVLTKGKNDLFAWRLLAMRLPEADRHKLIAKHFADGEAFIKALPAAFRDAHVKNAAVMDRILDTPESERSTIKPAAMEALDKEIVEKRTEGRELLMSQLIAENKMLGRPLNGLDITVTNILGSKGLGADVVFLVGFDQGKLPAKEAVLDSEVYQMLVALTRVKKRMYFFNTIGKPMSFFRKCFPNELVEIM